MELLFQKIRLDILHPSFANYPLLHCALASTEVENHLDVFYWNARRVNHGSQKLAQRAMPRVLSVAQFLARLRSVQVVEHARNWR